MKKTLTFAVRFGVLLCSFCLLSHATYGNHPTLYTPWAPLTVRSVTSCPPVTNLNVSEVTETTARVTWEPGGSETQWLYIVVMSDSTSPSASDPGWQIITNDTLQLDSLSEGHFYRIWVKADCGNGLISNASHVDLWTDCQDLSSFPYVENFNNPEPGYYHVMPSVGPLPHCWVERDHAVHLGSDGILRFHTFQNQLKIAILPRLADNVPITHLKMTFSYRNPYNDAPSTLFIGVMDDPFDISTFVPLDSATTPYDNWGWHQKEVLFENYSGSGRYIAMKYIPSSVNYFDVDNLALDMVYNCHDPYNVMATSISPGTAYITWDDEEGEDEWEVAIVPDYQAEPDSSQIVTVHQSEYHATNINDTNLVFFVRTHCSNGWGYSDWVSIPVTSFAYQPATVPYSHDFESGNENAAWRMETGNPVSRWQIGIPNGYSDSLLFVTNNGTDASYGSTIAEAWAYRDFQLSGATEYEIRFRWLCNGHSSYAYMHAMVGEPAPILVSTNYFDDVYPEGSVLIGKFALQDDWKTTRYVLGSENDNTVRRLYFRWRNVYNSVYPPGAVIDNVQIVPYHCPRPVDVTFEGATAHEAFISFSSAGTEQVSWQYVLFPGDFDPDTVSDVVTVQGTSIQITGLQANTFYTLYMRSACNNGYHSAWSDGVSFQTMCDPITLPYYEDFTPGDNPSGNFPGCWLSLVTETGIHRPSLSDNSNLDDGGYVLRFAGDSSTKALAILPEVPSDYFVNDLRLSFLMRTGSGYPCVIVGVMSDPEDISTFIPVDTVKTVESQAVNRMEVFFDHYQGSGTYIALISEYEGEYTYLVDLDDLVLEVAPSCLAPSDLRATNVSQHSATLWWTPANDEQAWEIAYGTEDFNPDSANNICVANVNPFVLTGLDEGTFYGCYVRALCSSGEYSEWSPLGYIMTRCAPMSVVSGPYQESFDSYTTDVSTSYFPPMDYPYITYPDCWTFLNLHVFVGCPPGVLPVAFLSTSSNLIVWGNSLHLVDNRVTPLYAVLPEFAEHLRFLKLTFSYKYATIRQTLSVGYMTDPSDGNTYHEVQSCPSPNNISNFTTLTIDYSTLGLAADSNYCIAFRTYDSVSGWTNAAIENVKVQLIPNAFPAPTQLVVNDITAHSATVDWTDGNGESHWVLQYRLASNPDWTDSMDVFSHPVFLDSLASNTLYDVRVKSVYGDSRTMCSDYTTTDFTTLDDTSVPDYDDFGQHVSIRPNPANQFIDVDLDEAISAKEILLYNAYGQWIKTIPVQNLSIRIGVEELSAGVYVVRVVGENGVATKRFVKE